MQCFYEFSSALSLILFLNSKALAETVRSVAVCYCDIILCFIPDNMKVTVLTNKEEEEGFYQSVAEGNDIPTRRLDIQYTSLPECKLILLVKTS